MNHLRLAGALAAVILLPTVAEAQTTITACYVPNSGSVYRINAPGAPNSCKTNHVQFSWQTDLTIGYAVRTGIPLAYQVWPDQTQSFYAPCDEGEVAVGGGFSSGGPALVVYDGPYQDNSGWYVTLKNPGGPPFYVTARAICLALPN